MGRTSALYLYAITDRPEAPVPAGLGLATGANDPVPLLNIPYREIATVVGPLSTTKALPTETNVWLHEAVVEALMADRTVLPLRFGTVLADEAAVLSILAVHYSDFVAGLQRVHGRVELGLLVLWDKDQDPPAGEQKPMTNDTPPPPVNSGRAYLLTRLEEERQAQAWRQQAEALAAQLHTPLAQLAAESTHQVLVTARLLLRAAYLVERDRVTALRQEVDALRATYPQLRFLCTGPWPAYSFVTAVIGAETHDPAAPEESNHVSR